MQDLLDKHVDGEISFALRFETSVTSAQKAAAWERLQARVQQQTQLPPVALVVPPRPASRWSEMLNAVSVGSVRLWHTLVLDTSALERARAPRYYYPYPYYDLQARWVQPAIVALSA